MADSRAPIIWCVAHDPSIELTEQALAVVHCVSKDCKPCFAQPPWHVSCMTNELHVADGSTKNPENQVFSFDARPASQPHFTDLMFTQWTVLAAF